MRYLVDTNVWINALAGKPAAGQVLQQLTEVGWAGFSAITRLEIFGFPGLSSQDEAAFNAVLEQFQEVDISANVIETAIRLRKQVKIRTPDALIAACALTQQAAIITSNEQDFSKVPELQVFNPDRYPKLL